MSSPRRAIAIVVNGPSSAGKSTLCTALHRALVRRCATNPRLAFFRVAFDDFLYAVHPSMLPRSFLELTGGDLEGCASREPHDGLACFEYVDMTGADDKDTTDRLARLELSEAGERFLKGQTAGWGKHLELGTNLLIDAFLQEKHWADDLREAIHNSGAKVINVVMTCNETELERREKQRGDRFPGMARHSAGVVHKHKHGEMEIDIDETVSTDDAVNSILHHLDKKEASVNDTQGQAALTAQTDDVIQRLQRAM
jgi:chloramphenicol 3-O phosphotransferase